MRVACGSVHLPSSTYAHVHRRNATHHLALLRRSSHLRPALPLPLLLATLSAASQPSSIACSIVPHLFPIVPRIRTICISPFQALQPSYIVSFLFRSVLSSALAADVDHSHATIAAATWTDLPLPRPTPRVEHVVHVASLRAHLGLHLCHVATCG